MNRYAELKKKHQKELNSLRKADEDEREFLLEKMKEKGYSYDFEKNKLLHSFNYEKGRNKDK